MSIAKLATRTLARMVQEGTKRLSPEASTEEPSSARCPKCGEPPDARCNQQGVATIAKQGFLVQYIVCPGLKKAEQAKMGS